MHRIFLQAVLLLAAALLTTQIASADIVTVTLTAVKDNTLYQTNAGDANQRSNGSGAVFFAGRNNNASNNLRRAVLAFDFSGIPSNAIVTSASLQLNMTQTSAGPFNCVLHKVTTNWGEGSSSTTNGMGVAPGTGDATWSYTFYNTQSWITAGGDFATTNTAVTSVDQVGPYTWSGPQLTADVQSWVASPAGNFGWLLQGDETVQSAKQFSSREAATPTDRPRLTITYDNLVPVELSSFSIE